MTFIQIIGKWFNRYTMSKKDEFRRIWANLGKNGRQKINILGHCAIACDRQIYNFCFRLCVSTCANSACIKGQPFLQSQGFLDKVTNWQCSDQCHYDCMWRTVNLFHRHNKRTPQFYGKWPFIRYVIYAL